MPDLYDRLKKLNNQTRYPYHMPGHKRNPAAGALADVMALDITEIDGFDDLHDATGIIREAQARAAALYGAEETFFLVNGSTAGVLAAVSAVCSMSGDTAGMRVLDRPVCREKRPTSREGRSPSGACSGLSAASGKMAGDTHIPAAPPRLLAGRASHQSLAHAAYLNRAEIVWLWESALTEGAAQIPGVVDPAAVMEALAEAAQGSPPVAVFITSPNYYGVVGDVQSIVEIAHSRHVPVIVDEAHGAHFGFGGGMPDSAVHAGADIVIQSVHKTLPSLTQTALLHVQGALVDRNRLRRFLRIYQTSSPSYVLMASIDACMAQIREKPDELFGKAVLYKQTILQQSAKWKKLRVLSEKVVRDPCKVVVSTADTPMTGRELYDILLENYCIQPEMAGEDEVVLILTGMDTEDGLEALLWSLASVDKYLAEGALSQSGHKKRPLPEAPHPERVCAIADAWDAPGERVALADAVNCVCAELVVPYPPGTPLLVPGERVEERMAARICEMAARGFRLRGLEQGQDGMFLRVAVR